MSWPKVELRKVMTLDLDRVAVDPTTTYEMVGVYSFGRGLFRREPVFGGNTSYKFYYRLKDEHVVMSQLFGWEGALALSSSEYGGHYVSPQFPTFLCDGNRLDRQFLGWLMRRPAFWEDLGTRTKGMGDRRRTLNPEALLSSVIPLPPLEEQRRIVARVEELAAKVEKAHSMRRHAVEATEALMAMVISDLFLEGTKRGWVAGHLGDYVVDTCYGTSEKTTDDKSGTPILRMGNIQNGRLDIRDLKYLHLNDKDREKLLLAAGDILVNRTNSAELVGKCAVFDLEGEYAFASYLIRLSLDTARAEPRLVASYINSPAGRAYMFSERKQMTGQANVNATKLKALPITLPPIPEQRRIVAYLDDLQAKVDGLKRLQAQTASELDALLPSILDNAFRGGL
ncbi:MAG: restriction endonuclease subunit S [Candidatus Binatia bacterium]